MPGIQPRGRSGRRYSELEEPGQNQAGLDEPRTKRPMLGLLLMHKIPWKTVGLAAAVTLVTLWIVYNINPLGIRSIVAPTPTS